MKLFKCDHCNRVFQENQVELSGGGKAAGSLIGMGTGAATQNPWAFLALTVLGLLIGHAIDENISPKCPICGAVLKLVTREILRQYY